MLIMVYEQLYRFLYLLQVLNIPYKILYACYTVFVGWLLDLAKLFIMNICSLVGILSFVSYSFDDCDFDCSFYLLYKIIRLMDGSYKHYNNDILLM